MRHRVRYHDTVIVVIIVCLLRCEPCEKRFFSVPLSLLLLLLPSTQASFNRLLNRSVYPRRVFFFHAGLSARFTRRTWCDIIIRTRISCWNTSDTTRGRALPTEEEKNYFSILSEWPKNRPSALTGHRRDTFRSANPVTFGIGDVPKSANAWKCFSRLIHITNCSNTYYWLDCRRKM